MAKVNSGVTVEFKVMLVMSEEEARALEALTVYSDQSFLDFFYNALGKHYLKPHEKGLRSLFASIRKELPRKIDNVIKTRRYFDEHNTNRVDPPAGNGRGDLEPNHGVQQGRSWLQKLLRRNNAQAPAGHGTGEI